MSRRARLASVMICMLLLQSVAAGQVPVCRNDGNAPEHAHAGHVMDHAAADHAMSDGAGDPDPAGACDCGCYCGGVCVHGCSQAGVATGTDPDRTRIPALSPPRFVPACLNPHGVLNERPPNRA